MPGSSQANAAEETSVVNITVVMSLFTFMSRLHVEMKINVAKLVRYESNVCDVLHREQRADMVGTFCVDRAGAAKINAIQTRSPRLPRRSRPALIW